MPELPEVQTIVNDLNKKIVGEIIVDFESGWKKNVRPSFSKFKKQILAKTSLSSKDVRPNHSFSPKKNGFRGAKIIGVRRIGKQIIIDLDNDNSILIHLKMTGHLLYKNTKKQNTKITKQNTNYKTQTNYFSERVNQYIRHKFILMNGAVLDFSDLRKFGWVGVVKTKEVENTKEIEKLGIDSLDKNFNLEKFKEILNKKKNGIIGIVLLDQSLIAGIGNIYRSEILFEAGVNPKIKVSSLKNSEIEKILKYTKSILKKAIKMRGTSDSDYRDTEGKAGGFQKVLKVYRREGEKCLRCDGKIKREKLAQRSIFYCLNCQK